MKLYACLCLIAAVFLGSRPDSPNPAVVKNTKASELMSILSDARRFPVEYEAWLAFLILDSSPSLLTQAQRSRILLDVLQDASSARYPSLGVYAGNAPLSLAAEEQLYLNRLQVDQLGIEMGVIKRMAAKSAKQAYETFENVDLAESPASCEISVVPNYREYYGTLQVLASQPPGKLPDVGEPIIAGAASRLGSASAIAGYLQMLQSVQMDAPAWISVGTRLARAFDAIQVSDRDLAGLDRHKELSASLSAVSSKLRDNGYDVSKLVQAFRGFLVRGLGGKRCEDFSLDRGTVRQEFADLRARAGVQQSVRVLSNDEIRGTPGGFAKDDILLYDDRIRSSMLSLYQLSDVNKVKQYINHDSNLLQPDDQDVAQVLQISQEDYNKQTSCLVCRFIVRQETFAMLLEALPGGRSSRTVIKENIEFLQSNVAETGNPPAWLAALDQMLAVSRTTDEASKKALEKTASMGAQLIEAPSGDAETIRSELAASSDPLIHLFWRAEVILKPRYKVFPSDDAAL